MKHYISTSKELSPRPRSKRRNGAGGGTGGGSTTVIQQAEGMFLSRLYKDIAAGQITFEQGLKSLAAIYLGVYEYGHQGGKLTPEGHAELEKLWVRALATIGDGTQHTDESGNPVPAIEVKGDSTFTGNLSSPEFVSGFPAGFGWALQKKEYVNAAGQVEYKYILECDGANIRGTMRVYEYLISQMLGENDNRIITAMMNVHHYDPATGKVWLSTNCGRTYNVFRVGDCIMVSHHQPGGDVVSGSDGYILKQYELKITEVGVGTSTDVDENGDRLDWVRFDNFATMMDGGTPESLIAEFDAFCRVDNLTDPERKGIIQMISVGTNAPYMDIIYGMKTDPQHALKGRIGNLEGIRTDDFGQLKGFGIYNNNFYGTGQFRNSQTGESLTAKISTTREQHASIYKETTYDISEDDNHVSNGFFVRELEKWTPCDLSGDDIDTQGTSGLFNSGGTPLMVNGKLISTGAKKQAVLTDFDGVPVLKLNGAGVAQDFADMKLNTTHKELTSDQGTQTQDVDDTLYMGIRILPVTEGTLKVEFCKQGVTAVGWQSVVSETGKWMTIQDHDAPQSPWDFTGTGKMIVSYTGQCLIRFVALTNDPVESLRADFSTKVTQTARLWRVEADATYSTRTEYTGLSVRVGQIGTEVTNNKQASDLARQQIESRLGLIETFDSNTATWMTQTDSRFAFWAGNFDANGNVKDLAQLRIDVNNINTTIGTLASTAAMNAYVESLQNSIQGVRTTANNNASAISQYSNSINIVTANFNSDGTVKASGSIATFLRDEYSWIKMSANYIDFKFTEEWRVWRGNKEVMWIDSNNNLCITGNFNGGNITNDISIGAPGTKRMVIKPIDGNYGAKLVGYNESGGETLSLGFMQNSFTTHGSTVTETSSTLKLSKISGGVTTTGVYTPSWYGIAGSGGGTVYCHANTEPAIVLSNSSNNLTISVDSNGHIKMGGPISVWNAGTQNGRGYVYVDGNGYLKVAL